MYSSQLVSDSSQVDSARQKIDPKGDSENTQTRLPNNQSREQQQSKHSQSERLATPTLSKPRPVTPHGILAQQLSQLAHDVDGLPSASDTFRQALKAAAELAVGLDPYIEGCTTPESPELTELTRKTQAENWTQRFANGETNGELEQEMLSGHTEGQFLKVLLPSLRAKKVLEIGLFTGYSALAMAEALPADGTLVACELDSYAAQFAQSCFEKSPHGHKIRVEVCPAIKTMKQLAQAKESFDFVFIDANKDGYVDYLNVLLESSLLAPNGLICVDNTLMQGQPYMLGESTANGRAIAHFNQTVAADNRVQQVLLPIRDGVTLIRRS